MKKRIVLVALILFIISPFFCLSASALPLYECANCGGSCGITEHTFWLKIDDSELYAVDYEIPAIHIKVEILMVEIPMYRMCTICGYSFYERHVPMPVMIAIKKKTCLMK